jgi:2-dehydro-3-deoxyphosphogalactonate aldolase
MTWEEVLETLPLIAILRGVTPEDAPDVAMALFEAGFRCVEVTLNSPRPLQSIAALAAHLGNEMLVGAGTVLDPDAARDAAAAGARLIISPNMDPVVIAATKAMELVSIPAFFSPTEAFAALAAGADSLKIFPAEASNPDALRAVRAVLPPDVPLLPVGGIAAESLASWRAAGATGFGIGGAIYKAGMSPIEVRLRAEEFVKKWWDA